MRSNTHYTLKGVIMDIVVGSPHSENKLNVDTWNDYMDKVTKKALPSNYNFEIAKSVAKIQQIQATTVALQMPEGLLAWGCEIADILKFFCQSLEEVIIMADVTYGACCIDDITAQTIGCDLIIHYGHSCLIPVTDVLVQCLYVFVEISFSADHLANVVTQLFKPHDKIFVMGTIQYSNVLREAAAKIDRSGYFKTKVIVPQVTPLLPGEVLGCTSPVLENWEFQRNPETDHQSKDQVGIDTEEHEIMLDGERKILFVADGRFHLESALIHNPGIKAYRFDPFNKTVTEESYDISMLHATRQSAIQRARGAKSVCLVLSMLGRQGNINILKSIVRMLNNAKINHHVRLLSEITIDKLEMLDVDAYVQVGCPRLSIDWGAGFGKPILNPYEAFVAFNNESYKSVYPMDYYSRNGGDWSNYTANRLVAPSMDAKEAILRRLQQRTKAKQLMYSS
ncbi:Diphthamide biosynthesis protein 1 [Babesia sp. Xinjiang]|uniref:Diphthamide biosynthesis protein 1 n=1 Tax=Babesia sp. Xinjiang TaxID=462227 RepID=UPI000A25E15C|nr:Diphthamide biosynthesis protein 1 [Babesia sp. Xinjiang]ORM41964.1 Diphthamide biosynthesis protein 1 [Babesia sp. Xinjiang]